MSAEHTPHSSLTVAGAKTAIQDALTWALDEHDYSGTENPQEYVRGALVALDSLVEQFEAYRRQVEDHCSRPPGVCYPAKRPT